MLPAGQSLVWSLAKADGSFEKLLRYPGEDGDYETQKNGRCTIIARRWRNELAVPET